MPPHLVMEPPIGRDDRILLLNRKREIEAVVDRMVEINRQSGGGSGELTHREGYRKRCHSQRFYGIGKILATDVATATHGPKRVADFREKEFRRDECRFGFQQARCLVGPSLP